MTMQLTRRTRQRTSADHTGNNGVDKRGRGTTIQKAHDNVPPVCGPQGGDSERQQVGRKQTTPRQRRRTRRLVCVRAVNERTQTESGATRHEDRRK